MNSLDIMQPLLNPITSASWQDRMRGKTSALVAVLSQTPEPEYPIELESVLDVRAPQPRITHENC